MALRDQPYIPLYIQDFLTDEKLMECSAESTGVYIRLMCLMHKSEQYGTILLKQKDKQSEKQIKNFALKIAKSLPYNLDVIERSLNELICEKVLQIDGDLLSQKRMVKDNELSIVRASVGSKGGKKTQKKLKDLASNFAKPKSKANSENEIEYENEIKSLEELSKLSKEEIAELYKQYPKDIKVNVCMWNFFADKHKLSKVVKITKCRTDKFNTRIKSKDFDLWQIMEKAKNQTFLLDGSWFGFDWIIENDTNYVKILENKYFQKETNATPQRGNFKI